MLQEYEYITNYLHFGDIVGGYRLWHKCSHCAISCTGPRGQAGVNPHRGYAEIVWKSCNLSAVAMPSPQPPQGNRIETAVFMQRLCGDGAVTMQLLCGDGAVTMQLLCRFLNEWPLHGAHVGIVQCHLRQVYGLRTSDYFH